MITNNKQLIIEVQFDYQLSPYKNKKLQDPYLIKFQTLRQQIISSLSPLISIDVRPKELPQHYVPVSKEYNNNLYIDSKKNKIVKFPRKQSFEISLDNFVIFSRLKAGTWPKNKQIVQWVFRVAQKISQAEKIVQNTTQQPKQLRLSKLSYADTMLKKTYEKSNQRLNMSLNNSNYRTSRFPSVRDSYAKQIQNYTNRSNSGKERLKNRYVSLRQEKQLIDTILPKGFNKDILNNYQTLQQQPTKYIEKPTSKKQQILKYQTIHMNQTFNGGTQTSFHWHFDKKIKSDKSVENKSQTPKMFDTPEAQSRVSKYSKNIELAPIYPSVNIQKEKSRQNITIIQGINSEIKDTTKIDIIISDSYLNYFKNNYFINKNYVKKKHNQQNWSPILAEHLLPIRGIFYVQLTVLKSKANLIQIGISPVNYYPKTTANPLDQTLVVYNLGTGMIRDNQGKQNQSKTSWRQGGQKITPGCSISIIVKINMIINKIQWFANQQLVASAKIPLQFSNGSRIFFSVFNIQDLILLNTAKKQTIGEAQLKAIQQQMKIEHGAIKKNNISFHSSDKQKGQQVIINNSLSQQNQLKDESSYDYYGRIKPNGSPLSAVKQKLQQKKLEDEKKYHELLIDLGMVNQNEGKIKKQRLLKYIQKKDKPQLKSQTKEEQNIIQKKDIYQSILPKKQQNNMIWFANYSTIRQKYLLFQSNPQEILLNYKKIYEPNQSTQQPVTQQKQKILTVKNISFKSQQNAIKNETVQQQTVTSKFKDHEKKGSQKIQSYIIEVDLQKFDERNKIIRDVSSQKLQNVNQNSQRNEMFNQQDRKASNDRDNSVKQQAQPNIVIVMANDSINQNNPSSQHQVNNPQQIPQNREIVDLQSSLLSVQKEFAKEPTVIQIETSLIKQRSQQSARNSIKIENQQKSAKLQDKVQKQQSQEYIENNNNQKSIQLDQNMVANKNRDVQWSAYYQDKIFKLKAIKGH